MMLFDTHAHLTDEAFDADREALIAALPLNGIDFVLTCGSDIADSKSAAELAFKHSCIYAAAGVHAHEAAKAEAGWFEELNALNSMPKVVALGEIGLDYHYDFSPRDMQLRFLRSQLELACDLGKPVVLHDREAHADMLDALRPFAGRLTGVMHCYSGSAEMLVDFVKLGLYIGFGGSLTFKNAEKTRRAAMAAPMDRILLETDSPYLAPVPNRGKRNEPAFMIHTCDLLAGIKGISTEEMAKIALENGMKLFGIEA